MNGPFAYDFSQPEPKPPGFWQKLFGAKQAPEPPDAEFITDYCCAENAIYMGFSWHVAHQAYNVADQAYNSVFNTALSTGVGFFDESGDGAILHDADQFEAYIIQVNSKT